MKSSKSFKLINKFLAFILKEFSSKLNANLLKKYSDYLFIFVEKIIVKFDKLSIQYISYYDDIIENEITLASITKKDKVLHIGSGSIPASSILITKKTGAKVIGIDKNHKRIQEFNRSKISNIMEVKHSDAIDYNVGDYDVIIISQGIEPRDNILYNISKKMKKDARVIFRTISNENKQLSKNDKILNLIPITDCCCLYY